MALNPFFLQGSPNEQRLMQSLIDEHLSMFGVDVYYIPRKMIDTDDVLGEVQSSKFNDAYIIEAYLNNFEGYAKGSDIMTKFGINLQNEITLTISRERYEDFIAPFIVTHNAKNAGTDVLLGERPKEGDLIFFPLGERLFEVKHVEHENPFYQLGKNYIYELQCELFRYEDEQFDTNVSFVDERALEEGEVTTVALAGIGSTALALVDSFASQGALQQIFLNDDGYGYTSAPSVVIGQSPAGVTSSRATAFAFTTERSGLYSVDQLVLQNPGFAYTEPPPFSFGGPGVGAAATSSLTNSGITSIRITDTGTNYFQPPTITIQHPSAVAIGTTGTVGSKPGQVQATAVATLDGNGISRIFLTNAGSGYEAAPLITIGDPLSLGVGTYFFNERVIGSQSGTEAFVKEWNEVERKLKLSINNGVFFPGEFITGTASSARYQILSHTGIDTTSPFTLNDEFEIAADNILDFTEKNPFGSF
nr:neck protein [uncultured Mediterranean phage uvMED]